MIPTFLWMLIVQGLGLAVLPLTFRVFGGLPDRGYGLSRVVGLVLIGWLAYLSSMLGFTAYVGPTVGILAVVVGGTLWIAWGRVCLEQIRKREALLAAE